MMVISTFRNRLFSLLRETSGNFGMMTALLLPVSIGVVGLGLDATTMLQNKRTLQNAVDAAALATATAMTKDTMSTTDADAMAKSYVLSQMANVLSDATTTSANLKITADISTPTPSSGSGKIYDVGLTSSYTMQTNALSQAFGWKTVTISAYGKAEASTNKTGSPLSMYLVLDHSGSMSEYPTYTTTCTDYNWYTRSYYSYTCTQYSTQSKIDALKVAVQSMAAKLQEADPDNLYVRMGADSYNSKADKEEPMAQGTAKIVKYVNALIPDSTTDARGALTAAYKALVSTNKTEAQAHGTSDFGRYIVFMTDGEMTDTRGYPSKSIDTAVRNQCATIKKDNIEIFTIAFNAPDTGQALLQACATDKDHYYQATDSASLIAAFGDIGNKTSQNVTRLTN